MFVLMGQSGPVVALSRKEDADSWAERFGWTAVEVPSGDEVTPMRLKKGFLNILQPASTATIQGTFVSFLAEEQTNFPDGDKVKEGEKFYRSNLENLFFSIPEEQNPNDRAVDFWAKLHARGLDLQRQPGEVFQVIKSNKPSSESPNPVLAAKTIALGTGNHMQPTGDPKLQVSKAGGAGTVDPTKPIPPGVIQETINGNVVGR